MAPLKTHCKNGHPLFGENIRMRGNRRICLACVKNSNQMAHFKKHGRHPRTKGYCQRFIDEMVMPCLDRECLIWPYKRNNAGYGIIKMSGKYRTVSKIVCERVYGVPPSDTHQAAHDCGMGHLGCVNPRHLSWKTPKENAADKIAHGTANIGANNPRAKINERDVAIIRKLKGRLPRSEVAEIFDLKAGAVTEIQSGRSWASVPI